MSSEVRIELPSPPPAALSSPSPFSSTAPTPAVSLRSPSTTDLHDPSNRKFSFKEIPRNRYRLFSACWTIAALGFNDGAVGALLPYIESQYNINYAVVSTIWLANSIGFISTALLSHILYSRLGRAGMMTLGPALLVAMYALICAGPPFGVVVLAFYVGGLGMAMVVAQVNVFASYMVATETTFGMIHGSYGIGATVSPIIATAMINHGIKWHYFYFILLGFNLLGLVFSALWFRGCDRDLGTLYMLKKYQTAKTASANSTTVTLVPEAQTPAPTPAHTPAPATQEDYFSMVKDTPEKEERKERSVYSEALHSKVSWLAAFVILFYQGAEVSIGGWIVSFMIDYRGGAASQVGYVSAGFWGGVTVGRFVLNPLVSRFTTPYRVIFPLCAGVIALELVTWLVPDVVGASVAVAIVGLFVGPMAPSTLTAVSDLLPRRIQTFSLTVVSAFGSMGGALWPFITGMLAQKKGTFVVHPVAIALFVGMLVLWCFLHTAEKLDKKRGEVEERVEEKEVV
ncbi:major facilitator superfamily domain-containing protein [Myxozyma melibiosi]|uniref:Major facilitator superfamily domain-containing protein n=1 Tax=Myxozyma melibiosi TaxID=54550 RepID=A0ABR1EXS2_9ASCO